MNSITTTNQKGEYLIPPDTALEVSGEGQPFNLGGHAGKSVLLVLCVTDIIEQESLLVSVWGSADGKDWGAKALFQYPERFYCVWTPHSSDRTEWPQSK